jgi:hypothetical protein
MSQSKRDCHHAYLHYEFNLIVHSPVINCVHGSSQSSTKISASVGHPMTSPCLLPSYLLPLFSPLLMQPVSVRPPLRKHDLWVTAHE